MSEPYGPPDIYAGYRDIQPVQSLVCLPPGSPRTHAEAIRETFDQFALGAVTLFLFVLVLHVWGSRMARFGNDIIDAVAAAFADLRKR